MIIKKNKLLILLLAIAQFSCVQTKKQIEPIKLIEQAENKYNKVISDSTNTLIDKVEDLEVNYHIIGCACPNWIRTKDEENTDTTKTFKDLYIYIEPADSTLDLPIYFEPYRHKLKIRGQFYERKDYPKGTIEMEEPMPKAKVFRYTNIEVIDNPNFKPESRTETLTLIYNAISCTCAQWSETRFGNKNDTKQNFWLEPADKKLINADTIFNGENLPVIIKVTGQVVTENGFPKRDLAKVSQKEAGKVFRYTNIEVVRNGDK